MTPRLLVLISLLGDRCASVLLLPGMVNAHDTFSHARGNRSSKGAQLSEKKCEKKNLAVFLDGSTHEIDMDCNWVPPPQKCESNMPVLWRLAKEVDSEKQVAFYAAGVGLSDETDDFMMGKGTRQRALEAYKWLSEHYSQDGDNNNCRNKIFVFGTSRGGLSARMLQGLIHEFGLAKNGFADIVTSLSPYRTAAETAAAKNTLRNSSNIWWDVKINHMGLLDSILRTLIHKNLHQRIKQVGMRLTPVVLSFAHAIALDDPRETFESHELYVDEATKTVNQVWFLGQHRDVMGGWPLTGLARIVAGWILDNAETDGLLLPPGWRAREEMRADYMEEAQSDTGFGAQASKLPKPLDHLTIDIHLRHAQVKNPNHCRDSPGHPGYRKGVRFHKSVQDRMNGNKGWIPLPYCCEGEGMAETGTYSFQNIEYVSNTHYNHWLGVPSQHKRAPWLQLRFGKMAGASGPAEKPFFLKVSTWTVLATSLRNRKEGEEKSLETKLAADPLSDYGGPATLITQRGPEPPEPPEPGAGGDAAAAAPPTGSHDFADTALVLPKGNRGGVATRLIVEVFQNGNYHSLWRPIYVGRVEIGLGERGESIPHGKIEHELSTWGTLEVEVDELMTDQKAATAMLAGVTPAEREKLKRHQASAQCLWLTKHSRLGYEDLCQYTSPSIPLPTSWSWSIPLPFMNQILSPHKEDCEEFSRQIIHGNKTEDYS